MRRGAGLFPLPASGEGEGEGPKPPEFFPLVPHPRLRRGLSRHRERRKMRHRRSERRGMRRGAGLFPLPASGEGEGPLKQSHDHLSSQNPIASHENPLLISPVSLYVRINFPGTSSTKVAPVALYEITDAAVLAPPVW